MTTTTKPAGPLPVRLERIGKHAALNLTLQPGCNVLVGPNGAGKTTAINAIVRALDNEAPAACEVTDGTPRGITGRVVVGGDVLLRVGATVRGDGTPGVELASTSAIADLVDPGLKDPRAADSRRVAALLQMVPIPLTDEVRATLASGDVDLIPPEHVTDVLSAADWVRKRANESGKHAEKVRDAARALAESAAHRAYLLEQEPAWPAAAELDDRESAAEAEATARQAAENAARVDLLRQQRAEREGHLARIRGTLGERPNVEIYDYALTYAQGVASEAHARVERVRAELAAAEAELAAADNDVAGCERNVADAQRRAEAWDRQRAALDEPITGPTQEEADAARALADEAARHAQAASLRARRAAELAEAETQQTTTTRQEERAAALREVARAVPGRLGEVLSQHGLPGVSVVDGRLYVPHPDDRRPVPFADRFSLGQRVRFALDLAVRAYPSRVVALSPDFWAALQPSAREEFHRAAQERGIYVLTERPTDGDQIAIALGA